MMQPLYGGAAARPFVTHHNTLDIDLYLRIAPELYLKRLIVGGMERVYEINRNFPQRGAEARGTTPSSLCWSFYQAYTDYQGLIDFSEELLRQAAIDATGFGCGGVRGQPDRLHEAGAVHHGARPSSTSGRARGSLRWRTCGIRSGWRRSRGKRQMASDWPTSSNAPWSTS